MQSTSGSVARALTVLLVGLAAAPRLPAQDLAVPDDAALRRSLDRLSGSAGIRVRITDLARSPGGIPIPLVHLTGGADAGPRPTLLVVAGAHAAHQVGTAVALAFLDTLAAAAGRPGTVADILGRADLLVVPRLNPDAHRGATGRPLRERTRNATPFDDDRDGALDEDGPDDLNGDGRITAMRVADPAGDWMEDPDDPGLMRPVESTLRSGRTWRIYPEGIDDDGDGRWNEDPAGGEDVSANFPHDYRWFGEGAGAFPVSSPESRALAELLVARDEIVAVVVLGPQDNLVSAWKAGDGRGDTPEDGETSRGSDRGRIRAPLDRPLAEDAEWFAEFGRRYREATGRTAADTLGTAPTGGDPLSWAYYQMGRWAFGSSVWTPPDVAAAQRDPAGRPEAAAPEADDGMPGEAAAGRDSADDGRGSARGDRKKDPVAAERRALRWMRASRPDGFVDWTPVRHPDFPDREVEVGGFAPFARWSPPAPVRDSIVAGEVRFLLQVLGAMPRVVITDVRAESLGGGAWRITARVANQGVLPTRPALGDRLQRPRAPRVEIDTGGRELVGGRRTQLLETLDGGGEAAEITWVVAGGPGRVTVRVDAPTAGRLEREVELR